MNQVGVSGGGHIGETWGIIGGLAEKLSYLLVHVTQEVHVRCSPAGALVLDQEVPEYQLGSVLLLHHHQLQARGEGSVRESEREREHARVGLGFKFLRFFGSE